MNQPTTLPDGTLVVPPLYAATVAAALHDLLNLGGRHSKAPRIRTRLQAVIDAAEQSGNAAADLGAIPENSKSKLGSAAAARILGVKPRRVRQLGQVIGGTRLPNGRWEFDPALVYAEAAKRKAA